MKPEELTKNLDRMLKDTQAGKLKWRMEIQTTEGNTEKCTVEDEGKKWTVDECYVTYLCEYRGEKFCMITYEMIKKHNSETNTVNYVFFPPLGMRYYSLHTLLPYSVEVNSFIIAQIHNLWMMLMDMAKKKNPQVELKITEAKVQIDDDMN